MPSSEGSEAWAPVVYVAYNGVTNGPIGIPSLGGILRVCILYPGLFASELERPIFLLPSALSDGPLQDSLHGSFLSDRPLISGSFRWGVKERGVWRMEDLHIA